MKIEIDEEKCIGCMSCTSQAPDVYEMNDDRKAQVKEGVDVEENSEQAQKGADLCPTDAIIIEE